MAEIERTPPDDTTEGLRGRYLTIARDAGLAYDRSAKAFDWDGYNAALVDAFLAEVSPEVERLRAELAGARAAAEQFAAEGNQDLARFTQYREWTHEVVAERDALEAAVARVRRAVIDMYGEDYAGEDVAAEVERLLGHLSEHEDNVQRILQRKNAAIEKAQAERDDAKRVLAEEITAIGEERIATRRVDVLEVIRERDALEAAVEKTSADALAHRMCALRENGLIRRAEKAEAAVERLEALCEVADDDDGTRFEDPMPLPGWVQLIRNALAAPETTPAAPTGGED